MRDIKFRARMVNHDEWAYGYLMGSSFIGRVVHNSIGRPEIIEVSEIAPDSICESTGLLDKNGKEIYEGDVLCWQEQFADGDVDGYLATVEWRENCAAWVLKNKHMNDGIVDYISIAEIVGDCHENPELLKGE